MRIDRGRTCRTTSRKDPGPIPLGSLLKLTPEEESVTQAETRGLRRDSARRHGPHAPQNKNDW